MPLVPENLTNSGLFIFALIWTISFLLLRTVRWRRSQATASSPRRATVAKTAGAAPVVPDPPESVRQWEIQFHELARDLSAQIDTKLGLLDQLLRATESERARLERVVDEARQLGLGPAAAGSGTPVRSADDPRWADRRGGRGPHLGTSTPGADVASGAPERRRQIYQLADDGFDPLVISHRTGVPLGEVELMLSLRSRSPHETGERAA